MVGAVLSVDHPLAGLIVAAARLRALRRPRPRHAPARPRPRHAGRGGPRARAARGRAHRPRRGRPPAHDASCGRVPAALEWLQGALALTVALAGARVAGADGTLLGVAQLVPAVVALAAAAGLLDAIVAPAAEADAAAADAAIATARDAPWAEVVFVGAGELGLRARLRAERRAPETTVLLWLEPAPRAWWRSAHPTLAEIGAATGAPRRRGRGLPAGERPALAIGGPSGQLRDLAGAALPAGERPALALGGPAGELRDLAAAVVEGIDARLRQSSSASSTK